MPSCLVIGMEVSEVREQNSETHLLHLAILTYLLTTTVGLACSLTYSRGACALVPLPNSSIRQRVRGVAPPSIVAICIAQGNTAAIYHADRPPYYSMSLN